jgi:hypothetical protein
MQKLCSFTNQKKMDDMSLRVKVRIDILQVILTSKSIDGDSESIYLILLIPLFFTWIDEFPRFSLPFLWIFLRDLIEQEQSVIVKKGFARLKIFSI